MNFLPVILGVVALFVPVGSIVWLVRRRARNITYSSKNKNGTIDISKVKWQLRPEQLWFGKSGELPAVAFYPLEAHELPEKKRLLDPSNSKVSSLGPALQTAASMFPEAIFSTGRYMRVVVNGPLSPAADGQSYLPFVRGADGKVSELARLHPRQLAQITKALMVWQVASVIVAQKHLADVSMKLNEIKKGIEDIKGFLENQRKSMITGKLEHLDQAAQAIMQGEFSDAIRHMLEETEGQMLQIQDHLVTDLRALTDRIAGIEHSDWVGTLEFTQNIAKHQADLYEVQQTLILCIRARAANWQVFSAFPGEERLRVIRKERILRSIDEFMPLLERADEMVQKKIAEVDSFFNPSETLEERRDNLERQHNKYNEAIASSAMRTRTQVSDVANRLLFNQKPMVLAFKVVKGKVLEAYELDES